jgi:hypothetical protein
MNRILLVLGLLLLSTLAESKANAAEAIYRCEGEGKVAFLYLDGLSFWIVDNEGATLFEGDFKHGKTPSGQPMLWIGNPASGDGVVVGEFEHGLELMAYGGQYGADLLCVKRD